MVLFYLVQLVVPFAFNLIYAKICAYVPLSVPSTPLHPVLNVELCVPPMDVRTPSLGSKFLLKKLSSLLASILFPRYIYLSSAFGGTQQNPPLC